MPARINVNDIFFLNLQDQAFCIIILRYQIIASPNDKARCTLDRLFLHPPLLLDFAYSTGGLLESWCGWLRIGQL